MWRQARRDGTRVAAMVLDLDHFKRLNDAHGHAAGDAVLRAVAGVAGGDGPPGRRPRPHRRRGTRRPRAWSATPTRRRTSPSVSGPPSPAAARPTATRSPPRSASRSPGPVDGEDAGRRPVAAGRPRRRRDVRGQAAGPRPGRVDVGPPRPHPAAGGEPDPARVRPPATWPDGASGLDRLRPVGAAFSASLWPMTLVAPDPTRAVPLPLREQADVRDRWLTQRLLDVLPGLMDRAGIDLWLVIGREYNEDPVLATLLPATWLSARRRTILALHRSDDGVTPVAVSRYPVGQFLPAWAPEEAPGLPAEQSQWAAVRRIVEQADPRRIGIDVSESFALADGLSHTEHRLLTEALGPYADRLVPAEDLAVGWLETRLPEEIAALHALNRLRPRGHRRGLLPRRHRRRDDDGARRRLVDPAALPRPRGRAVVPAERRPAAGRRAAGRAERRHPAARRPLRRGDRARRPGALRRRAEPAWAEAPTPSATATCCGRARPPRRTGCSDALRLGNRMQDLTTAAAHRRAGRATRCSRRRGRPRSRRASTPTSTRIPSASTATAPAPRSGSGTTQGGVPGAGDYPVHPDTVYALELAVRAAGAGVGRAVRADGPRAGHRADRGRRAVPRRPADRADPHPA